MGIFDKLVRGLNKTRDNFTEKLNGILKISKSIDEETLEELEELLILADIGVDTSLYLMDGIREKVKTEKIKDAVELKTALKNEIVQIFPVWSQGFSTPSVVLVVGVNGVGKTTTIGKLANILKEDGRKVILAAGDTFRAAGSEQLKIWGQRVGIDVISHREGSDPASVLFDALQAGKARNADIIICDTAGRLHTKKNLMNELKKLYRVCQKEYPQAKVISLMVLDATTGQNALNQAKIFNEAVDLSGIVLTKLDGTAKGGIAVAIASELKIPVCYVGVGEGIDDLQKFEPNVFVDAIID